jgi:hypothetical protein
MGNPSIQPIRIPNRVRKGELPKARDFNDLVDAVRALTERGWTSPPSPAVGADQLQFKIYGVRYDTETETYFCKVRPGWVRNRNADADATDPVKDWMPTAGDPAIPLDNPADADPAGPPEIEIADGQTVYCRVSTTDKGIIEEAPTIEAADTPEAGTHFQPPNASAEGDLYFPLANITITGDPAVVTIEQIQQGGPLNVTPNLPEIKNVGGKREVFKARVPAGDTYDFRTLEQLEGDGEPVIKDLDPGDSEADPPVAPEEEGDTLKFRRVAERATSPQIQVKDGGDVIRIEGNEYDSSESAVRKFNISIVDGLVTSFLKDDLSGWWGTVGIQFDPNGGSLQTLELDFEDGILVAVRCSQGVTGDGTEGDPGFVNFQIGDTDT